MTRHYAAAVALAGAVLAGCSTAPDAEKRPKGSIVYYVRVESSEPGVTIETNNVSAGKTPLRVQIIGDKNGRFQKTGSPQYVVRALPLNTNQFLQTQTFSTGSKSSPGARIPGLIFFDMNRKGGGFTIDLTPED